MKELKQNKCSLPSVARNTISLLLFTIAVLTNLKANAQYLDSLNFPINVSCNNGGLNANDIPLPICQNEVLEISGVFNPIINGTAITWTDISSHLVPANTNPTTITSSLVTFPNNALNASITFTAPGVYMFLLSGICNATFIGFDVEGDSIFATLEDTVRVTVLPKPLANAGPDQLSCSKDTATYGLYTPFYAYLNANAPGVNQIGSWHMQNATDSQDLAYFGGALTDTAAIFRIGYGGGTYTLYWTVEDTITGCIGKDSVKISIPGEVDPIWALDQDVCANYVLMTAGLSNVAGYSSPGPFSNYIPYADALTTTDTTFFTFYCISCPDSVTFSMNGATNMYISVQTAGIYTFGYWLDGVCMEDTTTFTVSFSTGTPQTITQYMAEIFICNPTDTFTLHNAMPDTASGEISNWILGSGLTAIGSTVNQDTLHFIYDGVTTLPLSIYYIIYNADTDSDCSSIIHVGIGGVVFPQIYTSPDDTLPCGSEIGNFSFQYQ